MIAQETTTLPEGATVSVTRETSKLGHTSTYLTAARGRNKIRMRVDNITPGSLRQYLELIVRVINKERASLKKKPGAPWSRTETIHQFVGQMAFHDMFIFETLTDSDSNNVDLTGDKGISTTRRKVSRHKGRKSNKQNTGRHAGNADGITPSAGEATG